MNTLRALAFIFTISIGCYLPIEVSYTFNSTAIVYPIKQWDLIKNRDGVLISSIHNYESGAIEDYTNYQFDRGDIVNISFSKIDQPDIPVDTLTKIAKIESNILSQRLIQLENEINIEYANLAKGQSGQKYAVIRQARKEISLANQELELRRKNVERANRLFPEGLISKAELEEAKNLFDKSQTKIELAERSLTVKRTGDKPEEIQYILTRIEALENERQFLSTKEESYNISSPISGKLSYKSQVDYDITTVEDVSAYILYIPVKLKDVEYLDLGDQVTLDLISMDTTATARLIEIGERVEVIDRNFVIIAKAKIEGTVEGISTGMPIKCKVSCGKISPIQYLNQSTRSSI